MAARPMGRNLRQRRNWLETLTTFDFSLLRTWMFQIIQFWFLYCTSRALSCTKIVLVPRAAGDWKCCCCSRPRTLWNEQQYTGASSLGIRAVEGVFEIYRAPKHNGSGSWLRVRDEAVPQSRDKQSDFIYKGQSESERMSIKSAFA
jgi:hypothetical protein